MTRKPWTEGHWYRSGVRRQIAKNDSHTIQVEFGPEIAAVWYDPKTHEGFADANLIAASPEMADFVITFHDMKKAERLGKTAEASAHETYMNGELEKIMKQIGVKYEL